MINSYKVRRRMQKKARRKKRRQMAAEQRKQLEAEEEKQRERDPLYLVKQREEELLAKAREIAEWQLREFHHQQWMEREDEAQKTFTEERMKRDAIETKEREERDRIRREFEEDVKRRMQAKLERQRREEEIQRRHQERMDEIKNYINDLEAALPESLQGTIETNPGKTECPYFLKTGVCRFGDKNCSKNHTKYKLSRTLLIQNFFRDESFRKNNDRGCFSNAADIIQNSLELNRVFNEFFDDVTSEMARCGALANVLACCNGAKHMAGNVYLQYFDERSALRACYHMNGRFYGGQRVNISFCKDLDWKAAVCGLSLANKCTRGNNSCNYLHLFRNPGGKYPLQRIAASAAAPTRHAEERRDWQWSETPERVPQSPQMAMS